MKTPKAFRRIGFILILAALAAAPLATRADDPVTTVLNWLGLGTTTTTTSTAGPGSCPVGGC
jgi:hypothetical protein